MNDVYLNKNNQMPKSIILLRQLILGKHKFTPEHKKIEHLLAKEILTTDDKNWVKHFLNHGTVADRKWLGTYIYYICTDQQCLQTMPDDYRPLYDAALQTISQPTTLEKLADSTNSTHQARLETYKSYYLNGCLQCSVPIARLEQLVHNSVPERCLHLLQLANIGQVAKVLNSIEIRNQCLSTGPGNLVRKAYSGKAYHGLTAQNLQLTADMTNLPADLVQRSLKENGVLTKNDRLKFCQAIPKNHICSDNYKTPGFVYCIEINSMTCKEFQVGITENIQHYVDRLQNQPNVESVRLHTIIDCSENVTANSTGKRQLEAYFIQQTILALFQPNYKSSTIIKKDFFYFYDDDDDQYDSCDDYQRDVDRLFDDFYANEIEFLNDQVPITQVCKVMKILANAIDEKRVIMNRQPSLDKKLCVDETNKCFYVDRDTLRQHLIEIAKTLCNENHVVLNPDCITASDKEFMVPLTAYLKDVEESDPYEDKVDKRSNLIRVSLHELLETKLWHLKAYGATSHRLHHDFSVAIIFAVGELDSWRQKQGLKPHDYLQSLKHYWDHRERLPQFMELIDGPEDDVTRLKEFIDEGVDLVMLEEEGVERMIDDKYRWPGPFYVSSFF